MNPCIKYFFIVAVLLFQPFIKAQSNETDSLKKIALLTKNDTVRLSALSRLGNISPDLTDVNKYSLLTIRLADSLLKKMPRLRKEILQAKSSAFLDQGFYFESSGNTKTALEKYREAETIALSIPDTFLLGEAINNCALLNKKTGNYKVSLELYRKALALFMLQKKEKEISVIYSNMALVYELLGEVVKAIDVLHASLQMQEKQNNKKEIMGTLNNIALIYYHQGERDKAIEYLEKIIVIARNQANRSPLARFLNNLAVIYIEKKEYDKARSLVEESIALELKEGKRSELAGSYSTLASIFKSKGDLKTSEKFYQEALTLITEFNDLRGKTFVLNNFGGLMEMKKNYVRAKFYYEESMEIAAKLGSPETISGAAEHLYQLYKKTGNFKGSLKMYELYVQMHDSISNQKNKKAAIKDQLNYVYEKKAATDSIKNTEQQKVKDAQLTAQNASLKQEKFQRYSLIIGLLTVLAGLGFVINRFRVTNKQKKIIEDQKVKVDEAFEKLHEKNKEVMDSIYYARRIQHALITNEKYINKNLKRLNVQ